MWGYLGMLHYRRRFGSSARRWLAAAAAAALLAGCGSLETHSQIVGAAGGGTGGGTGPQAAAASGGLTGHPVKLYVRDDQSDPGQNLADTQALVQQEHIVAEVSAWASQTQQASASYLRQQGIPVIGGDGTGAASWGQLPNFFPEGDIENTLVQDGPAAGAKLLFPKGDRNLAILVCQEGAVCSEGASIDSRYAPSI